MFTHSFFPMDITLRPIATTDLDNLVQYGNNFNIAKNLTNKFPHPYTREKGEAFLAMATASDPAHIFAILVDGEMVGAIGIHPKDDIECNNAEMGYWLAEPFWGKGIMSTVVPQMVDYGFQHFPINRIFARPFGSNTGSQKVLEKAGFQLEARFDKTLIKNGVLEDELIYAVRR